MTDDVVWSRQEEEARLCGANGWVEAEWCRHVWVSTCGFNKRQNRGSDVTTSAFDFAQLVWFELALYSRGY